MIVIPVERPTPRTPEKPDASARLDSAIVEVTEVPVHNHSAQLLNRELLVKASRRLVETETEVPQREKSVQRASCATG